MLNQLVYFLSLLLQLLRGEAKSSFKVKRTDDCCERDALNASEVRLANWE